MKGRLDAHQIELYKISMLELLCIRHSITQEKLDAIVNAIREDDK